MIQTRPERRRNSRLARALSLAPALLLWLAATAAEAQVPASERAALIEIFQTTDGSNWTRNANWLGPVGTECTWAGVGCSNDRVVELLLDANELRGPFPDLTRFPLLRVVFMNANELTGAVPDVQRLPELITLVINSNRLTGTIPTLGSLPNLEEFDVAFNELTGTAPAVSGVPRLRVFALSGNRLTGGIPDLSATRNLETLTMAFNQLTGPIPSLDGLTKLREFFVEENDLSGPLPDLSDLVDLEFMTLSANRLSGPIRGLSGLVKVRELFFNINELSGPIPDLSRLTELEGLELSVNRLSGPIPDLTGLSKLGNFGLDWNELTGEIPDLAGLGLSNLRRFGVWGNQLTGDFPDVTGLSRLEGLALSSNAITGEIHPSITTLPNLIEVALFNNGLFTDDPAVQAFLQTTVFSDFEASQTLPPEGIRVEPLSPTSVLVSWEPIQFLGFDGRYIVEVSSGGSFTTAGSTRDKTESSLEVRGLDPGTGYGFRVRTVTDPNPDNATTVVSVPSNEVAGQTALTGATGAVEFTASSLQAAEGESKQLLLRRVGGVSGAVSVQLVTSTESADSSDFVPLQQTVTWSDGDADLKVVELAVRNDRLREGDETLRVELRNPTGGAQLGGRSSAQVTLGDADLSQDSLLADLASVGQKPSSDTTADGGLVVVWTAANAAGTNVVGRSFDPTGQPTGESFDVSGGTSNEGAEITGTDVVTRRDGSFVVVWTETDVDSAGGTVRGQVLDRQAIPQGGPFVVRRSAAAVTDPDVSTNASGAFFVTWVESEEAHLRPDTGDPTADRRIVSSGAVVGRAFDPSASPTGQTTTISEEPGEEPDAAMNDSGGLVVIWQATETSGGSAVVGRSFDPGATNGSSVTPIDQRAEADQRSPAVTTVPGSNDVVVAWQADSVAEGARVPGGDVFAQRFDRRLTPMGTTQRVNPEVAGSQSEPTIAVNDDGTCVIGWTSRGGSFEGVAAQAYPGCGQAGGGQIELTAGSNLRAPNIAVDEDGRVTASFVVDDAIEGDGGISSVVRSNVARVTECVPTATDLCLGEGDRFRVRVNWRSRQGDTGTGRQTELTQDTGYFWFFDEDNVEIVIKVLDACSFANSFWVFAGGLTNVEVDLIVSDMATGMERTYSNPLGSAFRPVQDTGAFPTCGANGRYIPWS
ncbi:MAG: fibronectin type III domain-containing protein [Acidobacteriota bacterium]